MHGMEKKHILLCINVFFLALRHFLLFRPQVVSRALGSVARREPARIPRGKFGPGRGPWHVFCGFKVASPHGEVFQSRRAIQAHAKPRTWYRLKKCPTAHVICGVLIAVNVVRHYLMMEMLKECPASHVQVKIISGGSCDTVLSWIAARV